MKNFKKWFRYPISATSLVILFLISFFSIYKISDYQRQIYEEEQVQANAEFRHTTSFTVNEESTDWADRLKELPVCASIENVHAFMDTSRNTAPVSILLPSQLMPKYPLISGSMQDEGSDPVIILGQGLHEFTYKKDGVTYFDIEGEPYRVIAYIGSNRSDILDEKKVVYSDRLGSRLRKLVSEKQIREGLTIKVGSDEEDTDLLLMDDLFIQNAYQGMKGKVLGNNVVVNRDSPSPYIFAACLFCMANAVIVSELWLYERRKEIVVRVENGFTHGQLYWLMYKDVLRLSFFSALLVVAAGLVFDLIAQGKVASFIQLCWNAITMLLFAAVAAAGVLLYPVWFLSRKTPQEIISQRGGL